MLALGGTDSLSISIECSSFSGLCVGVLVNRDKWQKNPQ